MTSSAVLVVRNRGCLRFMSANDSGRSADTDTLGSFIRLKASFTFTYTWPCNFFFYLFILIESFRYRESRSIKSQRDLRKKLVDGEVKCLRSQSFLSFTLLARVLFKLLCGILTL